VLAATVESQKSFRGLGNDIRARDCTYTGSDDMLAVVVLLNWRVMLCSLC
jgi:hypothetical protein